MNTYHQAHFTENPARKILWTVINNYLTKYITYGDNILELGAGYCYWVNNIQADTKIAVDVWPDVASYVASDVTPIIHDLTIGLPDFDGLKFDSILASNLLEHLEYNSILKLVSDAYEYLNPHGCLITIQPNFRYAYKAYFDDYTHRTIFTHVSLANLMRSCGFSIKHIEARFMPYSLRDSKIPIKPWLIKAYLYLPYRPLAGQMLIIGQKN